MKKPLSAWSRCLGILLVPAALLVNFLVPSPVLAQKHYGMGRDGVDGSEGDPLDTNDFGGGGGGGDTHVSDDAFSPPVSDRFVFELDRFQILLVPQFSGGTLNFRIIVVDREDLGLTASSLEGFDAP